VQKNEKKKVVIEKMKKKTYTTLLSNSL